MIGYYKISRPTTCFFTILITILGYTISLQKNLDDIKSRNIALLMLTVCVNACNIAATNTINDVFDYYSDKINIPSRPLPIGLMTKKKASVFCFILYLTSIILSYFSNTYIITINLLNVMIGILYTPIFKYSGFLFKNSSVALVSTLFLVNGQYVNSNNLFPISIYIWLFTDTLCYEIYKDIRDKEVDKKFNCSTLATSNFLNPLYCIWTIYIVSSLICIIYNNSLGYIIFLYRFLHLLMDYFNIFMNQRLIVNSVYRYLKKCLVFVTLFSLLFFIIGN
jgi:4-hydroxybenzoate polyprenyltransferase